MPFKNFTSEVLTSNDVDTYLMRQGVMTFASAAARDSALSGVLDEGMVAYLEDAPNRFTYYDGASWYTIQSEWTTWVPTYTNITIGNGSATAVYAYIGPHTVSVSYGFTLGSTSAIGTSPQLTLPVGPVSLADVNSTVVSLVDTGGSSYVGKLSFVSGSNCEIVVLNAGGTYSSLSQVTSSAPHVWANTDVIAFGLTYRVS